MNTDQFDVSMIYTLGSVSLIVGWLWRASTSFHVEAPQSELTITYSHVEQSTVRSYKRGFIPRKNISTCVKESYK